MTLITEASEAFRAHLSPEGLPAILLVMGMMTSGCLSSPASTIYVTYLGDDVEKRAIELKDDEVREHFPKLVESMEEARERGPGERVHALNSDTLAEWLAGEAREQWEGSQDYDDAGTALHDRFQGRINWTGSTFQTETVAS